jgi:uncharacterized protein
LIFIDSNIPMYLIGTAHPHKAEAQILLERLIASGHRPRPKANPSNLTFD